MGSVRWGIKKNKDWTTKDYVWIMIMVAGN